MTLTVAESVDVLVGPTAVIVYVTGPGIEERGSDILGKEMNPEVLVEPEKVLPLDATTLTLEGFPVVLQDRL